MYSEISPLYEHGDVAALAAAAVEAGEEGPLVKVVAAAAAEVVEEGVVVGDQPHHPGGRLEAGEDDGLGRHRRVGRTALPRPPE